MLATFSIVARRTECPKHCVWQIWFPLIDRTPRTFVGIVRGWGKLEDTRRI
jgi:hypothetical protein